MICNASFSTYQSFLWTQTQSRRFRKTRMFSRAGWGAERCPWVCLYTPDYCGDTQEDVFYTLANSFPLWYSDGFIWIFSFWRNSSGSSFWSFTAKQCCINSPKHLKTLKTSDNPSDELHANAFSSAAIVKIPALKRVQITCFQISLGSGDLDYIGRAVWSQFLFILGCFSRSSVLLWSSRTVPWTTTPRLLRPSKQKTGTQKRFLVSHV